MPTAKPASARASLPSGSTPVDSAMISDAYMAWSLADAASVCLTGWERTMVFVELGCGEHHLAIERIFESVISNRMALPETVLGMLSRWLDGYAGSPEEPRRRAMIAEVRSYRFDPVPLRIGHVQSQETWPAGWSAYDVDVAG